MNEVMQIVAEKETITKEISDAIHLNDLKKSRNLFTFLYNLTKSDSLYSKPNRGPIIKAQIEKLLKNY